MYGGAGSAQSTTACYCFYVGCKLVNKSIQTYCRRMDFRATTKVFATTKMPIKMYGGRWGLRIRQPVKMMKRLAGLVLVAFVITIFLIFRTGNLQGNGSVMRLNVAGLFMQPTLDPIMKKFQGKDRMPPSVENTNVEPMSYTAASLLEYFLTMKLDAIEVTWAQSVNTRGLLELAMDDYTLMMIETNVESVIDEKTSNMTAVIAPLSDNKSDLKLDKLLDYVATYTNKGLKLNCNSLDSLQISLKTLRRMQYTIHAPIWLGVDVVSSTNPDNVPVDVDTLIELVKTHYPSVTFSLGWVIDWAQDPGKIGYSWNDVIKMAKLCVKFQQNVSFSIRAVYAARSLRQIKWLLSLSSRFSVILGIEEYDIVPIPELIFFRKHTDPKKVFYNLHKKFLDNIKSTETPAQDIEGKPRWDRTLWHPTLLDEHSLAFLGEEQAVLEGASSWLVSKAPHMPGSLGRDKVVLSGKVQFLEPVKKTTDIAKFSVFIRCSGVNPPLPKDVHGVKLVIMQDGTTMLSSQNLVKADLYKAQTLAKLPSNDCFKFSITDTGQDQPIVCTISKVHCEDDISEDLPEVVLHLKVPYDDVRQLFFVAVTGGTQTEGVVVENLIIA